MTGILPSYLINPFNDFTDYFSRASFGAYQVYGAGVLTQPNGKAFISRIRYDWQGFIVEDSVVLDILDQADAVYDFGEFDNDGLDNIPNSGDDDGYVDYVIFSFLNYAARGTIGLVISSDYVTDDERNGGGKIRISASNNKGVIMRKDLSDNVKEQYDYLEIWFHEMGHSLFNLPDIDHGGFTSYNHYGLGGFEVMSTLGFEYVPSPFNPAFCKALGWGTFFSVNSNLLNYQLSDFYGGGATLEIGPLNKTGAHPNQKFMISYHRNNLGNVWVSEWPVDGENGGVMIWHLSGDPIGGLSANYSNSMKMPIDIEAAHGKFQWITCTDSVSNTFVADPVFGYDSLEIRKIGTNGKELQGPYFGRDKGSHGIPFMPTSGKEFTSTSNPSSALYASYLPHPQNIFSDVAVKNIVRVNNVTRASLYVNAPPAAPANLQLSSLNGYVHLTWDANNEPDFVTYYVRRNGSILDSTTSTQFTDFEAMLISNPPTPNAYYFVTARDNAYNVSDPSNTVGASVRWEAYKKPGEQSRTQSFTVSESFPNPFNPLTFFNIELGRDAFVRITIVDMLGKEVALLANEKHNAGSYRFSFNANYLTSGMYFCRVALLSPNETTVLHSKVIRMVLMK